MNLPTAVKTVYGKYATFEGRASRSEFWFFRLFYLLVFAAFIAVGITLSSFNKPGEPPNPAIATLITVLGIAAVLFLIANIIPEIAVSVRRIHDTGADGAWFVLWFFFGIVGLIWSCIPGTPGDNPYGSDPRLET